MKVGVIGCGAIGQICHLAGYHNNPDTEIVAVADPSEERLQEVQQQFRANAVYTDPMALLAHEGLEAVSICTPNSTHAAYAVEAARRGLHILMEKPLAPDIQGGKAIKDAVDKSGVICMVNFTHRWFEGNIAAKAALDRGEIGAVTMYRIRLSHGGPEPGWAKSSWFYDKEMSGGGVLIDMGIHAIDLAQFMFGPITNIFCRTGTLIKDIDVEDTAALIVDNKGHSFGMLEVSWTTQACFTGIEIYGTDGSIIVDYTGGVRVANKAVDDEEGAVEWRKLEVEPLAGGWSKIVDSFVESIKRGAQPAANVDAGLSALRVALSAYESVRTGRKISC